MIRALVRALACLTLATAALAAAPQAHAQFLSVIDDGQSTRLDDENSAFIDRYGRCVTTVNSAGESLFIPMGSREEFYAFSEAEKPGVETVPCCRPATFERCGETQGVDYTAAGQSHVLDFGYSRKLQLTCQLDESWAETGETGLCEQPCNRQTVDMCGVEQDIPALLSGDSHTLSSSQGLTSTFQCQSGVVTRSDSGSCNFKLIIDSETTNVNIVQLAQMRGWNGAQNIEVIIRPGVTVGSTEAYIPAMRTGVMPFGLTLKITNHGRIFGAGGDGGPGCHQAADCGAFGARGYAEPGGSGLVADMPATLINYGQIIAGGGGGGGGGGGDFCGAYCHFVGSGGGGAGYSPGDGGGGGRGSIHGQPGTQSTGGAGGPPGRYGPGVGGPGGDGGALAAAGTA